MDIEIERKYLVTAEFKHFAQKSYNIVQAYLNSDPERTVRIRTKNDKAFITIKGKSNTSGMSRYEWEKEIEFQEAQNLLKLCEPNIINKTRYEINYKNQTFEVDEFHGVNKGLVLAEIELQSETDKVLIPDWLGLEVTGDIKYYNSYLSKNPFQKWENNNKIE